MTARRDLNQIGKIIHLLKMARVTLKMAVGESPSIELNLVELRASQNFANANKKLRREMIVNNKRLAA